MWFYERHTLPNRYQTGWYIDGLVQERRKSSALAMELRLSCTNPSICTKTNTYFRGVNQCEGNTMADCLVVTCSTLWRIPYNHHQAIHWITNLITYLAWAISFVENMVNIMVANAKAPCIAKLQASQRHARMLCKMGRSLAFNPLRAIFFRGTYTCI